MFPDRLFPRKFFVVLLAFFLTQLHVAPLRATDNPIARLPNADVWMSHMLGDLMRFWWQDAAFGVPQGAFPTVRCDTGELVNWQRPCPEVGRNTWIRDMHTIVAQSRQTYAYGVAFHMTGDVAFLDMMRKGVAFIRANFVDRERGGLYTSQDRSNGTWGPAWDTRNPQELAYGLLGMSFYYYLTRDPEVLPDILATKKVIFDNYYNSGANALQWMLTNQGATFGSELRLVAQLDQMNAYMVMMTPLLPEPHKSQWRDDLVWLSRVLIEKFYSPAENMFFLNANRPADLDLRVSGTDFGHTIKAMWMIRHTGLLAGDKELVDFVEKNAPKVLERAYLSGSGSWAQGLLAGGAIDINKSWWIYAELDQFAGSLAMTYPETARYLPATYEYYLKYFVDQEFGEVWNGVNGNTHQPIRDLPKAWQWKNGYHSMEHALVAYITTLQLQGEGVPLWFAFQKPPVDDEIRPYFYTGKIDKMESQTDARVGLTWRVTFRDVK